MELIKSLIVVGYILHISGLGESGEETQDCFQLIGVLQIYLHDGMLSCFSYISLSLLVYFYTEIAERFNWILLNIFSFNAINKESAPKFQKGLIAWILWNN